MKRLLYSILLLLACTTMSQAQTTIFTENFDGGSVLMNSVGSPGWAIDNTLQVSSPNSWRGQYLTNGVISTENILSFSTAGNSFVTFNFNQICKVDFLDTAKIEISVDNGATWTQLIAGGVGQNCYYGGTGVYVAQGNKFSEASYLDWDPANPSTPTNTWWKAETFDISQLAGNQANVQIRFVVVDNFFQGMNGRAGWYLDDVNVVMAICEQIPPTIALAPPIWAGNVYTLQQYFDVFAYFNDPSGIQSGELYWTINSDPTVNQAFGMINLVDSLWAGTIYNPLGGFVDGDTVCYWVEDVDASGCNNLTRYPSSGCIQFIIHDGIAFPFCDNFDIGGPFWTADPASVGSVWLIGPPAQATLNTPNSPPNVLGLDLVGQYQNSSVSFVNSVPFDFSQVSNAVMSFWHNRDLEGFWDGVNIQYTVDAGVTWTVIGAFPDAFSTNWYTAASVQSNTTEPVWDGNSNGWLESRYKLGSIPGMMNQAQVQFRFKFTSDPSVIRDGFNIDDFCIKIPCNDDLGINAYVAPVPNTGLPAGASIPITVVFENYGNVTQTAATINYLVTGGGSVVPFAWTGSLAPGAVTNITLPTSFVVPASGTFDVCTWVELTGDCDLTNDTVCASFTAVPTLTPTYCDDFESANIGWSQGQGAGSTPGSTWELGAPAFGQTTGGNAGSTNAWDINLFSGYTDNSVAYLYSPFFDFSLISAGNMSFALNWNVDNFNGDGTHLEYTTDGGATWNILGTGGAITPDPCGINWYNSDNIFSSNSPGWNGTSSAIPGNVLGWVNCSYGLCCSNNVFNNPIPVQFRFVFTSDGFTTLDGVSMDDFCITAKNGDDASVTAITNPVGSVPSGLATNVDVVITNLGSTTLTAFDVEYSINGIPSGTPISWTGSLAPCASITITFPGVTFGGGSNALCAYTILATDVDLTNDTLCTTVIGIPTFTPTYCDDFENGNLGWVGTLNPGANAGSVWELGTPAFGVTTGGNGGSANAWDINLTTGYTPNADAVLTSPYFDFSLVGAGRLSFALNYYTEQTWDGVRLEYTIDNGATWTIVGGGSIAAPDPCGTNWYTDDAIISSNLPAWENNSGGWKTSTYKLCCTTGIFNNPIPVQFRFVFTSDGSVQFDGFSMDDFCVYASPGADVGISAITSPSGGAPAGTNVPVTVVLENFGSTTVTSTVINYAVNGVPQTPITWNGTLLPCSNTSVTLPGFNANAGVNTICSWTELVGDINIDNDTICSDFIGQPVITPTYIQAYTDNFDFGNIGWAPGVQAGANPGTIWELGVPNYGVTTLAHSAPNAWDVNLSTPMTPNAFATLSTPYFDLTNANACVLSFWQNRGMNTFGDQLFVDYTTDLGVTWNRLGTNATPNTTNWYNQLDYFNDNTGSFIYSEVEDVNALLGPNPNPALVQFRFVFTTPNFSGSDGASIDDFELFVPIPTSVTPVTVSTSIPNTLIIPGQPITFATPIKNNGLNPIYTNNVTLVIDGVVISTDPVSYAVPGLLNDSIQIHNFANTWLAIPGFHEVCVYTDSPNGGADLTPSDDTTCVTVLVFDTIPYTGLPYCNSFETGVQWVTLNALTYTNSKVWELGAPTQSFLNSAHTGTNAWSIFLDTTYANTDSAGLFSSIFRIQANHCYNLNYWQQYRMEFGADGGAVDYSTDLGVTWNRIDYTGTPNVTVWGPNANYTYVSALDPNDPSKNGFTGIRNNWFETNKTFRPAVDGQMIIRWRFASDYSGVEQGWSIDDVCLTDLGPCAPLGLNDFAIGDFGLSQNYPNPATETTTFEYMIPQNGMVKIEMYDIMGQLIATIVESEQSAGKHTVDLNTKNYAAGIYSYTLTYNEQQVTKRMAITK